MELSSASSLIKRQYSLLYRCVAGLMDGSRLSRSYWSSFCVAYPLLSPKDDDDEDDATEVFVDGNGKSPHESISISMLLDVV